MCKWIVGKVPSEAVEFSPSVTGREWAKNFESCLRELPKGNAPWSERVAVECSECISFSSARAKTWLWLGETFIMANVIYLIYLWSAMALYTAAIIPHDSYFIYIHTLVHTNAHTYTLSKQKIERIREWKGTAESSLRDLFTNVNINCAPSRFSWRWHTILWLCSFYFMARPEALAMYYRK